MEAENVFGGASAAALACPCAVPAAFAGCVPCAILVAIGEVGGLVACPGAFAEGEE